jgi:transposase
VDARGLGEKRLAQFLARHHYRGRRPATELLARLRNAPTGRAAEVEADARRGKVLALVAALKPIVEQIRLLTSEIAHALRAHPDGEIFLSFFKDPKSVSCAATLLAEIGDSAHATPPPQMLVAAERHGRLLAAWSETVGGVGASLRVCVGGHSIRIANGGR